MATNYITCPRCSAQNTSLNTQCLQCGTMLPVSPMPMQHMPQHQAALPGAEKKLAAGLCGILLGGLGVHKFILGYNNEGIIMIVGLLAAFVITFISCGIGFPLLMAPGIVGLIEGIIYLTKSDEEFVQTYVIGKKPWF